MFFFEKDRRLHMKGFFFGFLIVFISSHAWGQQNAISMFADTGAEDVALGDAQLTTYSANALRGSGAAANKLGVHFLVARGDRKMAEYWFRISAEDGNASGEFNYGSMILADSSENKARAVFWLEKSASEGNEYAQRELKRIAQ
ncbi:sel1 repeat family protein [Rhodanobacter sp. MP7CTX1]|uniref:sel1 repeat family protein n=1 Tax=Rhodanobacter sp. MP7CTX1 TaxID=2723084 RepID=UPI0016157BFA|nr:sel1 repeat family protein [Rhodanobacter sp. MP7CTX1]MBB6187693.1 TPR repeat protein [Rhodanobacter sp. MP7CTX1]